MNQISEKTISVKGSLMMGIFENGKFVLALVLLWLVGSAFIFQLGPSAKLDSWENGIFFDMNTDYSDQEGVEAVEGFGEAGRLLYLKHFWFDLVFVLLQFIGVSGLFFYSTSKFKWSKKWMRWLWIFLLAMTCIDLVENFQVRSAISYYPDVSEPMVAGIRNITNLKMISIFSLPLLVLTSLLLLVFYWVSGNKNRPNSDQS